MGLQKNRSVHLLLLLQECNPSTLKIGLCDFEPVDHITDVNNQDIALDFCITPKKTYSFDK